MLNPQQMAGVRYVDGPLLVIAGAGSGKTRVITKKISYLIKECGYTARQIAAVTFTNKTAHEMKTRVAAELPLEFRKGLRVSTFHTLGLSILKKEAELCGLSKKFTIFDSEDSLQLVQRLLPNSISKDRAESMSVLQEISRIKNDFNAIAAASAVVDSDSTISEEAYVVYSKYQDALRAYNAVDFDDLIALPVYLLSHHEAVLSYWQQKIRYLLVDEYQDANNMQYHLVKLLTGVRARFTVVGDDDQSIYAWRGARPENLVQLNRDFPQLKIIKLEQNYRSTGRILQAANQLISHNPHVFEKKLWSEWGPGDYIRVVYCKDEQDEADQVVADMINHRVRQGSSWGSYAILYRGNYQSRVFETALREQGIPYRISGGQSWFSKAEIKDMMAYLKLLCNDTDDAAFLRAVNTPKRGIGDVSLEALGRYAKSRGQSLWMCCDQMGLSGVIQESPRQALIQFKRWIESVREKIERFDVITALREMIEESQYEAYLYEQIDSPVKAEKAMGHIYDLIAWLERLIAKKEGSDLSDAVNHMILLDILEKNDQTDDSVVQLLTLHAAKGLEFPCVYLVGMEEDLLPHKSSIEENHIEEERRLTYVGITRAQKSLCITLASQRKRGGERYDCEPSRFLDELPEDCITWFGKPGVQRDEAQSKAFAQSHLDGLRKMLVK